MESKKFSTRETYYVGLGNGYLGDVQNELLDYVGREWPDGATVTFGYGVWQGKRERQATITVYSDNTYTHVLVTAAKLAEAFGQDAVLANYDADVDATLVERVEKTNKLDLPRRKTFESELENTSVEIDDLFPERVRFNCFAKNGTYRIICSLDFAQAAEVAEYIQALIAEKTS